MHIPSSYSPSNSIPLQLFITTEEIKGETSLKRFLEKIIAIFLCLNLFISILSIYAEFPVLQIYIENRKLCLCSPKTPPTHETEPAMQFATPLSNKETTKRYSNHINHQRKVWPNKMPKKYQPLSSPHCAQHPYPHDTAESNHKPHSGVLKWNP